MLTKTLNLSNSFPNKDNASSTNNPITSSTEVIYIHDQCLSSVEEVVMSLTYMGFDIF